MADKSPEARNLLVSAWRGFIAEAITFDPKTGDATIDNERVDGRGIEDNSILYLTQALDRLPPAEGPGSRVVLKGAKDLESASQMLADLSHQVAAEKRAAILRAREAAAKSAQSSQATAGPKPKPERISLEEKPPPPSTVAGPLHPKAYSEQIPSSTPAMNSAIPSSRPDGLPVAGRQPADSSKPSNQPPSPGPVISALQHESEGSQHKKADEAPADTTTLTTARSPTPVDDMSQPKKSDEAPANKDPGITPIGAAMAHTAGAAYGTLAGLTSILTGRMARQLRADEQATQAPAPEAKINVDALKREAKKELMSKMQQGGVHRQEMTKALDRLEQNIDYQASLTKFSADGNATAFTESVKANAAAMATLRDFRNHARADRKFTEAALDSCENEKSFAFDDPDVEQTILSDEEERKAIAKRAEAFRDESGNRIGDWMKKIFSSVTELVQKLIDRLAARPTSSSPAQEQPGPSPSMAAPSI